MRAARTAASCAPPDRDGQRLADAECTGCAAWFARRLGIEGTRIAERISAFLLLCIGVQIMLTGIAEFVQPMLATTPAS